MGNLVSWLLRYKLVCVWRSRPARDGGAWVWSSKGCTEFKASKAEDHETEE